MSLSTQRRVPVNPLSAANAHFNQAIAWKDRIKEPKRDRRDRETIEWMKSRMESKYEAVAESVQHGMCSGCALCKGNTCTWHDRSIDHLNKLCKGTDWQSQCIHWRSANVSSCLKMQPVIA